MLRALVGICLASLTLCLCPPQPNIRDVEVAVTSCSGRAFLDTCHAECVDGFLGEGAIWICEEDNTWQNPVRHTCKPVSCGEPDFDQDKLFPISETQPCSSMSFGGKCPVQCQSGHHTTGSRSLSTFDLLCTATGEWQTTDNVTCIDINGCENNPCDPRTSTCEDIAAPENGWYCMCKEDLWAIVQPNGDGSECRVAEVRLEGGEMHFNTGLGLDVHFVAGDHSGSISDLHSQAKAKFQRISNPSEVQEAEQAINDVVNGAAAENARRVADLISPDGIVTQQGMKITQLEVQSVTVEDTFEREVSRAQRVQSNQAADLRKLEIQALQIKSENSDLDGDHQGTKSFAEDLLDATKSLSANSWASENVTHAAAEEAIRRVEGPATGVEALQGCVKETTLDDLVAAILQEFRQTVADVVVPLQRAACLDNGQAFSEETKECLLPPLGTSSANPATSCAALLNEDHGKTSGKYWIQLPAGPTEAIEVYCDQTRLGGGWELAMKAPAGSKTFDYHADYWTTDSILNPTSLNLSPVDAKFENFNYAVYDEAVVHFTDSSFSWSWRVNMENRPMSAFFNSPKQLSTNPRATQEFVAARGRFSYQTGYGRYVIGTCGTGRSATSCMRWGFVFNNEADDESFDAMGGLGVVMAWSSSFFLSAGDTYFCCGVTGSRRSFSFQLLGRAATDDGN